MQDHRGSAGVGIRAVEVAEQDPRGAAPHKNSCNGCRFVGRQCATEGLERVVFSTGHCQRSTETRSEVRGTFGKVRIVTERNATTEIRERMSRIPRFPGYDPERLESVRLIEPRRLSLQQHLSFNASDGWARHGEYRQLFGGWMSIALLADHSTMLELPG
jgi:hypothetical protein